MINLLTSMPVGLLIEHQHGVLDLKYRKWIIFTNYLDIMYANVLFHLISSACALLEPGLSSI